MGRLFLSALSNPTSTCITRFEQPENSKHRLALYGQSAEKPGNFATTEQVTKTALGATQLKGLWLQSVGQSIFLIFCIVKAIAIDD